MYQATFAFSTPWPPLTREAIHERYGRNGKERSVKYKLGLLGWLEKFPMKCNNSKVRVLLHIWNKWKEHKIYDHITRLPMSFFHVTINKLSWPPMKTFPNCFWQYMLQKLRKVHQERTLNSYVYLKISFK